ncbi:hypothetical protein ECDEC10E_3859 [Escherichia coli DEC10E]|nr:hypothetical protein ECDEC10E_3859 [Escherichia coli DEC10E]
MNTYGKKSTLCKIHYLIEKLVFIINNRVFNTFLLLKFTFLTLSIN